MSRFDSSSKPKKAATSLVTWFVAAIFLGIPVLTGVVSAVADWTTDRNLPADEAHTRLIGARFEVAATGGIVHWMTLDPATKTVAYGSIIPAPGIAGREVVAREPLPVGTRFRISGAHSEKNFYAKRQFLEIEFERPLKYNKAVRMSLVRIGNGDSSATTLNPQVYKLLSGR